MTLPAWFKGLWLTTPLDKRLTALEAMREHKQKEELERTILIQKTLLCLGGPKTGHQNMAFGYHALSNNVSGSGNVRLGPEPTVKDPK